MPRPDVSDERIPQILDAAATIFSQHGIDGASMSQIAEAAELSKATIYHYFDSKDALVEALVRRLFEADQPEIERLIADDSPAIDRLRNYALSLVDLLEHNALLYPIVAEYKAISTRMPVVRDAIKRYFEGYLEAFTQIIQQGIERNELKASITAEDTALALVALIEGCILVAQNLNRPLGDIMRVSVDVFLNNLK